MTDQQTTPFLVRQSKWRKLSIVFTLLFYTISLSYSIYQALLFIYRRMSESLARHPNDNELRATQAKLGQLPNHLALVFHSDNIQPNAVATILVWAAKLRIPRITLYDSRGTLKQFRSAIELLTNFKLNTAKETSILFLLSSDTTPQSSERVPTTVYITSAMDGHPSIIEATKRLAISMHLEAPGTLNFDVIDGILRFPSFHFEESPDMLIKLNNTPCHSGFMPWHLRYTEIHELDSAGGLTYARFISALDKYSKCSKRFGS